MAEKILQIINISKSFPGVKALDNVSFDINKGEVHCLVGENGAGKSTLIKILTGVYKKDEGTLIFNGEKLELSNPHAAMEKGIAVVHQELNVLDFLTVADNITLGREINNKGFVKKKDNNEFVRPFLEEVNLNIEPSTIMGDLSVANKQLVMIAKALSLNASIIILDEPTAMLSEKEVRQLFKIINKLRKKSVTIVYISHRMEEIFEIGDRVSVLKDGCYVSTANIKDTNEEELCSEMVGRELNEAFPERNDNQGECILEVSNLSNDVLKDVSFKVRKGEILGISGLVGSGRTELLRAIFGADKIQTGTIKLKGKKAIIKNPYTAIKNGIALIPEDRRNQGVIRILSVKENMTLIYSRMCSEFGFLRPQQDDEVVDKYIKELEIKTPNAQKEIGNLSGGNQQKVVLAKWLAAKPDILLLDEPTQGIDVGAKSEIYYLINKLAKEGMAVIMVSSELVEVLNLSHRVLVMRDGAIKAELNASEATEEKLITYAMGVEKDA